MGLSLQGQQHSGIDLGNRARMEEPLSAGQPQAYINPSNIMYVHGQKAQKMIQTAQTSVS